MSEMGAAITLQFPPAQPVETKPPISLWIEPEALREVLRNVPVPVAVLTTALDDRRDGMTISSFMTVALEPPLVAVSLTRAKPATSLTLEAGCFAINLLDVRDHATADRFASHHSLPRFDGLAVEPGPRGLPTLTAAIAVMYASVVNVDAAGDHYLITGEVFAFCNNGGVPLIRHQSRYKQPSRD
jgi:3-hydroxy-9,10-secoandrosta-1,3,5(10)-triene-9,17-dione monooxygenase reductase component